MKVMQCSLVQQKFPCFNYFVSFCVHNQKLLLILISLLTETLRGLTSPFFPNARKHEMLIAASSRIER